jgi:hypothetical protein
MHGIYHLWCGWHVRRTEAKKQREREKRNAHLQRIREEAEARAQRVFDDLERGIPLVEMPNTNGDDLAGTRARAICSFDARQPSIAAVDVFCLPAIRVHGKTSGLLLRLAGDSADHYERMGVFEVWDHQLRTLPHPPGEEVFVLV